MDFDENNGMEEDLDNIIVLNDEDGNDVEFEFLDLIELDSEQYVVLLPVEEQYGKKFVPECILKLLQPRTVPLELILYRHGRFLQNMRHN